MDLSRLCQSHRKAWLSKWKAAAGRAGPRPDTMTEAAEGLRVRDHYLMECSLA